MRLGPEASFEELLHKLDSIYGNAANRVDILKELHGVEQRNDENVINVLHLVVKSMSVVSCHRILPSV
jgi:hypothetical protein